MRFPIHHRLPFSAAGIYVIVLYLLSFSISLFIWTVDWMATLWIRDSPTCQRRSRPVTGWAISWTERPLVGSRWFGQIWATEGTRGILLLHNCLATAYWVELSRDGNYLILALWWSWPLIRWVSLDMKYMMKVYWFRVRTFELFVDINSCCGQQISCSKIIAACHY